MTLPGVDINQLDGALGIMPPVIGDIPAVIGPSTSGTVNQPVAFARGKDVESAFGAGPLVELASYLILKSGKPVVCVKSNATTDGAYGSVDASGVTGSSVPTADATTHPIDEYDVYVLVVTGGTIGVAGITYKYALDSGDVTSTLSAETALGTASTIDLSATYGVKINFAAGTLVAGDVIRVRTTPPTESAGDLVNARTALAETALDWDFVVQANTVDASGIAALDTWLAYLWTSLHKHKGGIANIRRPTTAETEAQYLTAATAVVASSTSIYAAVGGGYAVTQSAVSGRVYRRPVAWVAAARAAKLANPAREDMAQIDLGPLPSDVRVRDLNGNRLQGIHDEYLDPGLDGIRLLTLRTFTGRAGVFVTLPRLLAPTGSDYQWWQYRKVMNRIADAVQSTLELRLRRPVLVSKKTGYILESEALDIESNVNAAVRAVVSAGPDVSAHEFVLSRTDNILSTGTLNGEERVVPLAYPTQITINQGFVNPARAQAV